MIINYKRFVKSFLNVLFLAGAVTVFCASSPGTDLQYSGIHNGQEDVMVNIPAADTLNWYHGTIKIKMQDGSFITPFGMDIIFEKTMPDTTLTHRGTTNNGGRYYLKTLKPGRYKVSVQHNKSTVYTDSMKVQQTESSHLDDIIIDIKQLEQKKQSG